MCRLALHLIRIAGTAGTWNKITDEFSLLTLGIFAGLADTFRRTAELTKAQRDLLAKLNRPHPIEMVRPHASGGSGGPTTSRP